MGSYPSITPDSLELLEQLSSSACLMRDEQFKLVWCNEAYERMSNETLEEMLGTRMHDYLPKDCADERVACYIKALETDQLLRVIQLGADERLTCILIPINAEAFGHRGVINIIQQAPTAGTLKSNEYDIVLRTPCMTSLGQLSTSELRVLYHIALGKSTKEIADKLERSGRTIENQIASMHNKVGTGSRAQLVKYAVDRGIHGFSEEEWEFIIMAERDLKPAGS
jgi:DNA-binding NarL/FixJ family response regulator